jgi:hypothetical protein
MEITQYTPINKGAIQGSFSMHIKLGEFMFEINNCTLLMSSGRRWINLPQKEYTDASGQKKYFGLNRIIGDGGQQRFSDATLKLLDAYFLKNAQQAQPARQEIKQQDDLPF